MKLDTGGYGFKGRRKEDIFLKITRQEKLWTTTVRAAPERLTVPVLSFERSSSPLIQQLKGEAGRGE